MPSTARGFVPSLIDSQPGLRLHSILMTAGSFNDTEVVLWETLRGLRCTFVRRVSGLPFEVTIQRGADVLERVAFEDDVNASDFAIAAMRRGDKFDVPGTV